MTKNGDDCGTCRQAHEDNAGMSDGARKIFNRLMASLENDGERLALEPTTSDRKSDSMNKVTITSKPFTMGTEKEAAVKILEEASEVFAAWQNVDVCGSPEQCNNCSERDECEDPINLADELADCVQACVNLAYRYDIDLAGAVETCEERNRIRGRYT